MSVHSIELCITSRRDVGVHGVVLSIRVRVRKSFPLGFIYIVRHLTERKRQSCHFSGCIGCLCTNRNHTLYKKS